MKNRERLIPCLLLLLITLLKPAAALAYAEWIPVVLNFGKENYGKGYATWRISTHGRWTYFANESGLLEYNGIKWKRYPMRNRSEARGVLVQPEQHRIWVGGENEFGFYDVTETGLMEYHCLSDSISPKDISNLANVFDFYESGGVTFLRCDFQVVKIAGDKVTTVTSKDKFFSSVMWNGTVYAATDNGLRMLAGNQFLPVVGAEPLNGKRVNTMLNYNKGILIPTATDGLYFFDGKTTVPLPTSVDGIFRDGVVCCAAIKGDKLAVGTIHFGVIVVNLKTGDVEKFDDSCGLQSNTVQSIAYDDSGNLWVGLDCGIAAILLTNPFTLLYQAPRAYGIGYTAILDGNRLYLGTDRGLFYTYYPVKYVDRQTEIFGAGIPWGSAWYLYRHGDEILCMHDKGIYTVKDGHASKVTDLQGAWYCIPVSGHPDELFVGLYQGVYIIKKVNGTWTKVGRVNGIFEPGRYLEQTAPQELKVYNPKLGTATIYTLDKSLQRVASAKTVREEYVPKDMRDIVRFYPEWDLSSHATSVGKNRDVIPFSKGFMLLNRERLHGVKPSAMITALYLTKPNDSIVYAANFCQRKSALTISYKYNSVRLEYGNPRVYPVSEQKFQYRLNRGAWSEPTLNTSKEFSDLHEGKYTFEVRYIAPNGEESTDSITFRILPPWYRTWGAILCYLLFLGAVFYFLWRVENRRLERKKNAAVAEMDEEVHQMKVEISQLEKDKMELDLRHKSQEIANLMLSVSRKNDILNEIKGEISKVAMSVTSSNVKDVRRQLLVVNNKIDSNMEGDEVLKRFEEEFDLVNDNFMKKLQARHPGLNYNERMMCAYLKMSLSTKEIAPLLNISVRGVETIRYRLRKKLGLERDTNLTEYMNSLTLENA